MRNENCYDDIINLPHHRSDVHPHMSLYDRAAQFSPFSALTGHAAVLSETERLTDAMVELDESMKEELDMCLQRIQEKMNEHPHVSVIYFEPDDKKDGGAYVTIEGSVKSIDRYERAIVLEDGRRLDINRIIGCNIKQDI